MHAHAHLAVLAVCALALVPCAAGTMCDVDADYNGAAIAWTKDDGSPGGTCDSVQAPMLTSLGKTSWNDATCESMASTTWGSGATVLVSLNEFGANCCGSLAKTRCYDDSTMCDVDADFNGAAIAWTNDDGSAGGKCDSTAGGILARLGKASWNALTCGSMASTVSQKRTDVNVTALEEISWYGANCCGSLAKTRCFDSMCKDGASFKDSAVAGRVAIPGLGPMDLTCGGERGLNTQALSVWKLSTSNPTMQWSDASCADMTKNLTTYFNRQYFHHLYLNSTMKEFVQTYGAACCGSLAKAHDPCEVLPPARANPVLGGRHVLY